jgi:hypothetical protein
MKGKTGDPAGMHGYARNNPLNPSTTSGYPFRQYIGNTKRWGFTIAVLPRCAMLDNHGSTEWRGVS